MRAWLTVGSRRKGTFAVFLLSRHESGGHLLGAALRRSHARTRRTRASAATRAASRASRRGRCGVSVFVLVKINRDAVVGVGPGLGYESSSLATGCGQLLSSKTALGIPKTVPGIVPGTSGNRSRYSRYSLFPFLDLAERESKRERGGCGHGARVAKESGKVQEAAGALPLSCGSDAVERAGDRRRATYVATLQPPCGGQFARVSRLGVAKEGERGSRAQGNAETGRRRRAAGHGSAAGRRPDGRASARQQCRARRRGTAPNAKQPR